MSSVPRQATWSRRQDFAQLWNAHHASPKPVKEVRGIITHYESFPFSGEPETREHRGKPWYVRPNPWTWAIRHEPAVLENVDEFLKPAEA